jgi:molecular chaperone HtpG
LKIAALAWNEEIIRNHFLQVGRSYYTTPEFRRRYSFIPTSRFGIGFLSVFNVSSHITVETLRLSSSNSATSIRLTLTGPRNYLIVENGDRRDPGTIIRVRLNRERELSASQLTTEISKLCRRVEFPIFVDELGRITEIKAEQPSDFTFETEDA